MTLGLIWAQAANGVIGDHGRLPWHLPEDLRRFKALTLGSTVVMGRATWESLPDRARPLPDRHNVVLTRQPGWRAEGATPVASLEEALAGAVGDTWVIGGATVYLAALVAADVVELTELQESFPGDVFAPSLEQADWEVVARDPESGWRVSSTGLHFRTRSYRRRR
ncbi:MAG: dihydrofolate reductase [Actinomycetota bacterium]|nr:dihydrofolate reductase [Actinomycetota bacterium]